MATKTKTSRAATPRPAAPAPRAAKARAKAAPAKASASATVPVGREALLEAAVRQFAQNGYDKTSMRDIAGVAGMLAGSIYYYFPTKEHLFLAVHEHAIRHICDRVRGAMDPQADPWTQLTQAAQCYLESMLNEFEYASIAITEFPRRRSPELRTPLIEHRRQFEDIFDGIVKKLPLRRGVDRTYFRLAILGMLAWSYTWYSPSGPDSPKVVAQKMVALLRESTQPT
jgi:AcrR family transcriptional regulator